MKQYVYLLLLASAPLWAQSPDQMLAADVQDLCNAVDRLEQKMMTQEKAAQQILAAVCGTPTTMAPHIAPAEEMETVYRKAQEILVGLGLEEPSDESITKCGMNSCSLRDCCAVVEKIYKSVGCDLHRDLKKCCKKLSECCKKTREDIEECCDRLDKEIHDSTTLIIDTITTCCEQIIDTITALPDCCDTVTAIFDTVTRIETDLNDCCTNLTAEINNSTTLIVDTITTCCEEIKDAITALPDCCDTVTAIFDTVTRIEVELNDCCTNLTAEINNSTTLIVDTVTTCCQEIQDAITAIECSTACAPTGKSQTDFGPDLTLSISGNYCLTENVTGDITITGDNITLDLNERLVSGRIIISGTAENAIVRNGEVNSVGDASPTSGAIDVLSGALQTLIENVFITTPNSNTNGADGRTGISNAGTETIIQKCIIKTGNGSTSLPVGNGSNGGIGISNSGPTASIKNCIITTGNGALPGPIGGPDKGGSGGTGISTSGNNTTIVECNITTGNGVQNGAFASGTSGKGGDGISTTGASVFVISCIISTGNGGSGGFGSSNGGNGGDGVSIAGDDTKVTYTTILKTGSGGNANTPGTKGNGGHGIFIANGSFDRTEVRFCTISNTGAQGGGSGAAGLDGRAVEDENTTGTSVIYQNFAFAIANTLIRYKINNAGTEGGVQLCGNPANSTNGCPCPCPFDNVYVPGTCTPCD